MGDKLDKSRYHEITDIIIKNSGDKLNFLWDCENDVTVAKYYDGVFPDGVKRPFDYLASMNMVDSESAPVYRIFRDQIEDGIQNGTDKNEAEIVLKMNIFGGAPTLVNLSAVFGKASDSRIQYVFVNIRPFTDSEIRNQEILSTFTSDRNPAIIEKRIHRLIRERQNKKIAFIQFDVEHFKLINDNYSPAVGDRLLALISEVLNLMCGDAMPHSRLSADLYMFVMTFDEKDEIIEAIRALESRILGVMDIDFKLCFGIYIMTDPDMPTRRCGDNAGIARQTVKGNALENIAFFDESSLADMHKVHNIEEDMNSALRDGEFLMFLQPKVSISSGRIIGAEALTRWKHHAKGLISPGDFIPVFEKNGFILKLDRFIWESAARQIRSWLDAGIPPVPISVNVSRTYLKGKETVKELYDIVNKYDIPIGLLQIEITESAESADVERSVELFKESGFTMLMDDFGSGYSSLNTLQKTKFDVLKIDRFFLNEFMVSERGRKILGHTISMSKDIGLDIIAEGVETKVQAEFLSECGCDAAQGFLYSKPIDADSFDLMLKNVNIDNNLIR
ncbi:MAG: GGDEF domain-containing phosphodiesterase [Butyrivibrio sp.]|nr:GGDEF domain-containing phosphodiesterase [Butyrivibrio sp.]